MIFEIGQILVIHHQEKGNFTIKLAYKSKNYLTGIILIGKAKGNSEEYDRNVGDKVTFRISQAEISKAKGSAAIWDDYHELNE